MSRTNIRLENNFYLLEIEPEHGALVRVRDKVGNLELITEPRLGENFRLLLPIPGMHANYILGTEQKLGDVQSVAPDVNVAPDVRRGKSSSSKEIPPPHVGGYAPQALKLHWPGPLQNERGKFDLDVTLWIELVGEEVRFRCEVHNRTAHQLAEVWYGLIGGMTGLGNTTQVRKTKCLLPMSATQWTAEPFREFGGGSPPNSGLGLLGPEYTWWYPGQMPMPWASFYHDELDRAVYFANYDDDIRVKVFRMTLSPGTAAMRADGDWPRADEVGGLPLGVTLNWTHFPYTKPGETFVGSTVVLRCHDGGWQEAAGIYRTWFEKTFGLVDSRQDWLRGETTFLDTMFLLPEDNLNLTFRDIPAWAKTAADHGVTSVMISGWQVGGHDRGYPQYEPDPRLGTYEDLKEGIRACHEMGLRVYFFANVQTVDIATDWYKTELHQYEIQDPWGAPYFICGWGMGTVGARKGLTRTPLYEMDPAHPEVRALLVRYFRKLTEIGADGIHLDKNFIHPLDFNPRLKLSPDRAMPQGMLQCIEEIYKACREVKPDFCMSYENNWDQLLRYSDVFWWASAPSPLKIAFPQWTSTNGIAQPYAYNSVNVQVLSGNNIMVGPANYMRGMDYPPMQELCRYIGEVTRIRRALHASVSRGRWVDSHEKLFASRKRVLQMSGSFAESAQAGWTVFADAQTGKRTIVLANLSGAPLEITKLGLADNATGAARLHQPFEPTRDSRFPLTVTLPAERVAFVEER